MTGYHRRVRVGRQGGFAGTAPEAYRRRGVGCLIQAAAGDGGEAGRGEAKGESENGRRVVHDRGGDGGHGEASGKASKKAGAQGSGEGAGLPGYRLVLHNDEVHAVDYVVDVLLELTPLTLHPACEVMLEAHTRGHAQVLVTHRERAELYAEQFASKELRVSIEPVA